MKKQARLNRAKHSASLAVSRAVLFIEAVLFAALFIMCAADSFAQDGAPSSVVEYWKKQKKIALEERAEPVGSGIDNLEIPAELKNTKQFQKLAELVKNAGFKFPMDFVELAERRAAGTLVDVPLVTENYLLDVGASATKAEFTSYSFKKGKSKLTPARRKVLSSLAKDFNGQKYDLNKPADRKQMRRRLLSMLSPSAKAILDEIASEYKAGFNRPLQITSLARSMDYQVELNSFDPNSYRVRDGSVPPHVSGLAFDISFRFMTAAEQNFLMQKIAGLEKVGKIDGLREEGTSQVFHIFVFPE